MSFVPRYRPSWRARPTSEATPARLIKDLVCRTSGPTTKLTPREKDILRHIAEGLSSKEIAAKLGISVHTVLNHRSRVMQKTGLLPVAQLSLHAARLGLVSEIVHRSGAQD